MYIIVLNYEDLKGSLKKEQYVNILYIVKGFNNCK